MMSFRQWLVLLVIYVVFMVIGAFVFVELEIDNEMQERDDLHNLKLHVIDVVSGLENDSRTEVEEILEDIGEECDHDFLDPDPDSVLNWSLWNSFFFTFTVITTIGFGHMAPRTPAGKGFCIAYAFIGVPLNGIVVASLSEIFSSKIINWDVRQRAKRYEGWVKVVVDAILYLVPGLLMFLVVPAGVLMAVEHEQSWTYLDSFYFAFITLTTIGFGDQVAGQQTETLVWLWVYKVIMVIWIIFGLGYLVMIITFVQKALKSRHIHNLERKLVTALKSQAAKVNTDVHRDLKRLRTVVKALEEEDEEGSDDGSEKAGTGRDVARKAPDLQSSLSRGRRRKESMSEVRVFLDLVESLLREHEATAASTAYETARHIVDETGNSDRDEESPVKNHNPRSYHNEAFVDDESKADTPTQSSREENRHNETLQNQLRLLLRKNSRTAVAVHPTDCKEVKTAVQLLEEMECVICDRKQSCSPLHRTSSVPSSLRMKQKCNRTNSISSADCIDPQISDRRAWMLKFMEHLHHHQNGHEGKRHTHSEENHKATKKESGENTKL